MKPRRPYSIVRLTMVLIAFLLVLSVLMSLVYCVSFMRTNYQKNLSNFQAESAQQAQALNRDLMLAQRQLAWVTSSFGSFGYWITDNPYEKMLYGETLNDSLNGIMPGAKADAVFISQRSSDGILWESHSMKEEAFLHLLDTYSERQPSIPASPGLFCEDESGLPTHMIFSQPVYATHDMSFSAMVMANAYMALPLDSLLAADEPGMTFCLCARSGERYRICYTVGDPGEALQAGGNLTVLEDGERLVLDGEKFLVSVHPTGVGDYCLLSLLPEHFLSSLMYPSILQGGLLILCMLGIAGVGMLLLSGRIYAPVKKITGGMQRIRQGDYGYRLEPNEAVEMEGISSGINRVLDELEQRTQQMMDAQKVRYERELLYRESKFLALQSQINPHFLYNTLECVRSIAWSCHIPEVPRVISDMIQIYRYSAANSAKGTVSDEMNCVRQYMDIMNVRFGNRYRLREELQEDILNVPLPRMVLQPLVENAISHGLSERGGGEILLSGQRLGGEVILRVRDNGAGISREKLEELRRQLAADWPEQEQNRIGLYNVAQRLKHMAEGVYALTLEAEEGRYTEVTIRIREEIGGTKHEDEA